VQPAFSPDGTSIAFVSTRSSRTGLVKIGTFIGFDTRTYRGDIWVAPALGGQARRLAENGNVPAWHPSGRTLIYVSGQKNHRTIVEVSIDSRQPKSILSGTASSWEITRLGSSDLWILDLSHDRRWERVEMRSDSETLISQACWAKDSRHLALMRHFQNGTTEYRYVALDGSSAEQLIAPFANRTGTFPCAFSPDGQRIVYTQLADEFSQLFAMDMASRRTRQLTRSPSHKYEAAWSPDGRWLAFSANTDGGIQVWSIPVDGGDEAQLTTGFDRMLHLKRLGPYEIAPLISVAPDGPSTSAPESTRTQHPHPAPSTQH
jgi:Tol biopolymer transport system component